MMRGFLLVFRLTPPRRHPIALGAWFRTTQDADTRPEFDDCSTHHQKA
jgi:hypothetical protein